MTRPLWTTAKWIFGIGALLLLILAVTVTRIKHRQEIDPVSDEQKLARSLEIVRTSTPEDRKVLKVLFYGQSITKSGWTDKVVSHWHEAYPNTVFVVENRAIGGFASQWLVRTTQQDIAAFYPDLIIFHVYGDHRKYEQIIRYFRTDTAADVLVQTDHGEELPDPVCEEGLQVTLHRPAGCASYLWLHQRLWSDEMSYHKIPSFAKEYGLAMEPQRGWWRDYLLKTHVAPKSLLKDHIHPNEQGKVLLANFFNQYFDTLVARWNGQTSNHVQSHVVSDADRSGGQVTLPFTGSRIELLTSKPLGTWPSVTIDGVAPKDLNGCYQVTRASSVDIVPDWPAVRQISIASDHVPEEWTATVTDVSADQKKFHLSVTGSVTGADGEGDSEHDFVSKSGRVRIESQDWVPSAAFEIQHTPLPSPFIFHWAVRYVCGDTPEVIDRGGGAMQYRYVLGTALANQGHILRVSAAQNDLADSIEFRSYEPPLK
jgi:hypothetical protein